VAIPDDYTTTSRRARPDTIALILILFGVAVVLAAAWLWEPLAFMGLVGALIVGVGVYLGFER
jgi:uncharacterized membrane protein